MKKSILFMLAGMMAAAAQAILIDDFEDTTLLEYTKSVVLEQSGTNAISFASPSGAIQVSKAADTGAEQVLYLRGGWGLAVGESLRISTAGADTADYADFGIAVCKQVDPADAVWTSGTADVRNDAGYVAIYLKPLYDSVGWAGYDGGNIGSSAGVTVPWADLTGLFILRTAANEYQGGYSTAAGDTVLVTWAPPSDLSVAVGFYADVRAETTYGDLDNLRLWKEEYAAHDPSPSKGAANVGTPIGVTGKVDLTLAWKAGMDPSNLSLVNPDIKKHYVYLSKDQNLTATDPNLYYVAQVDQSSLTDPNASYVPSPTLNAGGSYLWMVEEGLDNGLGGVYGPGDPNNIPGPQWTFQTLSIVPVFAIQPADQFVFAGQTAEFSVDLVNPTDASYLWYKDDAPLSDGPTGSGSVISGSDTATLTITNAQIDDEGAYFCRATNDAGTRDSATAILQINRLVSYYPLETDVQDAAGSFDMILMQEGTAGLPALMAGSVDPSVGAYSLLFDNGDHAVDPNGRYAQIGSGVADYTDISITAWIWWEGGANWQRIFDFGNDTSHYMFLTPSHGSQCRFVLNNGGGEQMVTTTPLPTGQWVHVAVTLGGNTGRLYVNGEPRGENTAMNINPADFSPTLNYIGKSQFVADAEFDGRIDDLKIYNYEIDVNMIAAEYYNATGIRPCIDPDFTGNAYNLDNTASSYCKVDLADFAVFARQWLASGLSTGL